MKGIILGAGKGSRLFPITKVIPKVLVPVYDRPMIYYSIELLAAAGITDIMIVVSPNNQDIIKVQLGNGEDFGVNIQYGVQKELDGAAGALRICRDFLKDDECVLIFGDNVFLGNNLENLVNKGIENLKQGFSSIFAIEVENPKSFGVLEVDSDGKVISIEEKPENPKSNLIAPGLYVYDNTMLEKLNNLTKSKRGEYEITDVNNKYLNEGKLKAIMIDKSCSWYDAGTPENLLKATVDASTKSKELNK